MAADTRKLSAQVLDEEVVGSNPATATQKVLVVAAFSSKASPRIHCYRWRLMAATPPRVLVDHVRWVGLGSSRE
jgi:hypothetical protein